MSNILANDSSTSNQTAAAAVVAVSDYVPPFDNPRQQGMALFLNAVIQG